MITAAANIARGTRQLSTLVERWLAAYAREMARQEIARLSSRVAKQKSPEERRLEGELRTLLLRFGLRQSSAAAMGATKAIGRPLILPGTLIDDAIAGKKTAIKWFWEQRQGVIVRVDEISRATKEGVRRSVREIIAAAQSEKATPSMGELARRIHTTFHGDSERPFVFSPERAAVIAQTELAQAENLGTFEGYKAVGVESIEWLARRDGKSGDRHHERMHGVRVKVSQKFTLPSGARLRFPGDPLGPISETVNCRCTTRAVVGSD